MRRTWYPFLLIAASLALPATASMAPVVDDAPTAPPSDVRYDVKIGKRPGYTWVQGHWTWDGTHYIWVAGRWIRNRPGYHWVADAWAQSGEKWHDTPGHWVINLAPQAVVEDQVDAPDADAPVHAETPASAQPDAGVAPEPEAAAQDETPKDDTAVKDDSTKKDAAAPPAKPSQHPHAKRPVKKPAPAPDYHDQAQWPFIIHR